MEEGGEGGWELITNNKGEGSKGVAGLDTKHTNKRKINVSISQTPSCGN